MMTGCATRPYPPLFGDFIDIHKEPYKLNVYDCTNKSSKYARVLRDNCYHADILILSQKKDLVGRIVRGKNDYHAVTAVTLPNGEILYCDVTNGKWSRNYRKYGRWDFIVRFEERLDEERFGDAFFE
jgi:hypothetical protein